MSSETSRRIQHGLVALCIIGAPLALGAAHPPTVLVLALILLGACTFTVAYPPRSAQWGVVTTLLLIALGATLLQLVPLPLSVHEALSPGTYDVYALVPGSEGQWRPLSLDPPATAQELLELIILLCGAHLATHLYHGRRRQNLQSILGAIAWAGGAVFVVGCLHAVAGLDRPYGTFGPLARGGTYFTSSFVNPNHLAGFLGFASLASFACSLRMPPRLRWVAVAGAVVMGAGVILSLSRGGMAAYALTVALCGVVLVTQHRNKYPAYVLFGAVIAMLGLAGAVAYTQIQEELWSLADSASYVKAHIWVPLPQLLRAFPLLGVGRGAFGMAYPRFSELSGRTIFTHLENEWLQTLADWGPLVGGVLLAGTLYAFLRALRSSKDDPFKLVALFALVYLGLHNMTDFNLTLPSVALPAVMLLSVLARGRNLHAPRPSAPARRAPWAVAWAVTLAITLTAGIYGIRFDASQDYNRLEQLLAQAGGSEPDPAQLNAILARHPTNFFLPLMVANHVLNQQREPAQALRWINRAMYLSPRHAGPHRLAGRALIQLGHVQQGLLEYHVALQHQPAWAPALAAEVVALTGDVHHVPSLRQGDPEVDGHIAWFLLARQRQPALALEVLETDGPAQGYLGLTIASAAHRQLGNHDAALRYAESLQKLSPGDARGYAARADALLAQEKPEAALRALEEGIARTASLALVRQRAQLLLAANRPEEAVTAARALLKSGSPETGAWGHGFLGQVSVERERWVEALEHYQRASQLAPHDPSYAAALVQLRMRLGDYPGARRELQRMEERGVRTAQLQALAEALKEGR